MMEIVHYGRWPAVLSNALVEKAAKLALKGEKSKGKKDLGLVFVTEAEMLKMNKKHRGMAKPTDVLSFGPADFPGEAKAGQGLGDVVICPAYVKRDAAKSGVPYDQQLLRVLVHGILHLMGYDHAEENGEKKMFAKQERVIKACGL